MRENSSPRD